MALLVLRDRTVSTCRPRFDPEEHGHCWIEPLAGPLTFPAPICMVDPCRAVRTDGSTYFGAFCLVDAPDYIVRGQRLRVTLLPYVLTERLTGRLALVHERL